MNILYIESNRNTIDSFLDLTGVIPNIKVKVAESKEDAIVIAKNNLIDLFIINLDGIAENIGDDLSFDISKDFFRYVLKKAAFTPVYFLSSSNINIDVTNYLLSESHHIDLWGDGESSPTIKVFSLDDLGVLTPELTTLCDSICLVDGMSIDSAGKQLYLTPAQKRVLKVFTRKFKGVSCHVKKLDGGLSQSRVLQIRIDDINGASRLHAVAKLDNLKNINKDVSNYTQEISRLPVRAYAPQVGVVKGGASNSAGVFYRLLKSDDLSLFQLLVTEKIIAAKVVVSLMGLLSTWYEDRPRESVSIQSIRQEMVSDEEVSILSEKFDLGWIQEVERINVNSRKSSIHGDLHGENVFVSNNNEPVMIDFGDVRVGASVFDPITLELSLFTHPSTKESIEWLPNLDNSSWADLDTYLIDCPYSNFIRACRDWSHKVAGGDQAVNAGAYAYLLRQLKYSDVDHELIMELLKSVKDTIIGTE